MTTHKRKNHCCDYVISYLFLLWDGLGFFGYDNHKLKRLKGIKPKWYDKFKNIYWIMFNISFLLIITVVLV